MWQVSRQNIGRQIISCHFFKTKHFKILETERKFSATPEPTKISNRHESKKKKNSQFRQKSVPTEIELLGFAVSIMGATTSLNEQNTP